MFQLGEEVGTRTEEPRTEEPRDQKGEQVKSAQTGRMPGISAFEDISSAAPS